jgi:hypothetical protein
MAYEVNMRDDGILQITFGSLIDGEDMHGYVQAYELYRKQVTEENPLQFLVIGKDVSKVTSSARKAMIDMLRTPDPRAGKTALVGGSR